ncbi:YhdP family protein [Bordetella tumulicola]|uniref:YhdP family protein n=1 Tax=Bordetella tumulicola TaxID=1649133 RepID=UPI0039F001DC
MTRFRYKGTIPQDDLPAHRSVSLSTKVIRCLYWSGITVYFVAAATLLGLRYWILPNIDQWRPKIEAYASDALGTRVEIGHLKASWRGLNPSLQLTSLTIDDPHAESVLSLPTVSAVLGWRSVLVMEPRLLSLRVDGAQLWARRDATNHLWIAGQSIDLKALSDTSDADDKGRSPLLRWLAAQRDLALVGATVHWQDDLRQAPEVVLNNVSLRFYNGLLSHRFALNAEPPAALARALTVRGNLKRNPLQAGSAGWAGELYAELDDAEPQAWAPWLSVPAISGRTAARAWLTLDEGKVVDVTADAALRELRWRARGTTSAEGLRDGGAVPADHATAVHLASGTIHVQGPPGSVVQGEHVSPAETENNDGLAVRAELTGLGAHLPTVFATDLLQADTVRMDATVRHPAQQPLVIDVRQFNMANRDLDVSLQGRWTGEGKTAAGNADFQGTLVRGAMSAIHKYLPLTVSADAREWLAQGLPEGQVRDASVTVQGDLDDFPFEDEGDVGQFRIAGAYHDAIVDYAPARRREKGWPRLENVSGNFAVDKVSLSLDSPGGATARTGEGHDLKMGAITAAIPNMEHNSTLHLEAQSSGSVSAYLALAANYQLGHLLDGALDEAEGTGSWQVPLKLEVPLLDAEETKVDGDIVFAGNDFRFVPQMPMLRKLRGELHFSEKGLRTDELRTEFLGGPARIAGKLESRQDALRFDGTLPASGLRDWVKKPVMERLSGQTPYSGRLAYGPGGVLDISVDASLDGMAIDLPSPLGKSKEGEFPLKVRWAAAQGGGGKRDQLSVSAGSNIALLLEHDRASRQAGYFARGALGVSRPATLPASGMVVDVQMPELDIDAWERVAKTLMPEQKSSSSDAEKHDSDSLPTLTKINLKTGRLQVAGWGLDELTLQATRPQPERWLVNLTSRQATGTVSWQEASGAIAGQVTARFKHLAFGKQQDVSNTSAKKESSPDKVPKSRGGSLESPDEELSDIPAIDLQAEQLSLYGYDVGALEVLGTNMQRGQLWRLDKLRISNESAELDASGNWLLKGSERGLTVDTKAQFKDLGAFVDRIGLKDRLTGGSGTVTGKLTWRDLPWSQSLTNIEGQLQISLGKGRLLTVNSRGARLLELLSVQSLSRLARLEFNPTSWAREGFPFDTIVGDIALSHGIAHTEGFKVNSPAATIVLAGDANIVAEQWDLKAVVIPNLDVSGAAVAAALAVNPLIGLGAFVTQWLLKQPLAHAMTVEYGVTGSWNDPKLEPVETKAAPKHSTPDEYIEH